MCTCSRIHSSSTNPARTSVDVMPIRVFTLLIDCLHHGLSLRQTPLRIVLVWDFCVLLLVSRYQDVTHLSSDQFYLSIRWFHRWEVQEKLKRTKEVVWKAGEEGFSTFSSSTFWIDVKLWFFLESVRHKSLEWRLAAASRFLYLALLLRVGFFSLWFFFLIFGEVDDEGGSPHKKLPGWSCQ